MFQKLLIDCVNCGSSEIVCTYNIGTLPEQKLDDFSYITHKGSGDSSKEPTTD